MAKFTWYNVYLGKKLIDEIAYGSANKVDTEEIRRSLVEHDGYDPNIRVVKARKKKGKGPIW